MIFCHLPLCLLPILEYSLSIISKLSWRRSIFSFMSTKRSSGFFTLANAFNKVSLRDSSTDAACGTLRDCMRLSFRCPYKNQLGNSRPIPIHKHLQSPWILKTLCSRLIAVALDVELSDPKTIADCKIAHLVTLCINHIVS